MCKSLTVKQVIWHLAQFYAKLEKKTLTCMFNVYYLLFFNRSPLWGGFQKQVQN